MKHVIESSPFSSEPCEVSRTERADLREQLAACWLNNSNAELFGMPYLSVDDGIVAHTKYYAREDVLFLRWENRERGWCINVYVNVDGSEQIDEWVANGKLVLDENDRNQIHAAVLAAMKENATFIERQKRFLAEKPWTQLHGLSVQAAVNKLAELGW